MNLWLHQPQNPQVAKYVDCYWFLQRTAEMEGSQYPKLNPDPCAHLLITPKAQAYHYHSAELTLQGKGTHWLYPHSATYQMDHTDQMEHEEPFKLLGVKFHPGALYAFALQAAQPECNQTEVADLSEWLGITSADESLLLAMANSDPKGCYQLLEQFLLPLCQTTTPDRHFELVQQALPYLGERLSGVELKGDKSLAEIPISQLGDHLHCSQRTLERSFLRATGITLKQCQSMNKLDALLTSLYQLDANDIDWTDVAHEFGFSDQPHLIRYLKSHIGATPKQYAKQRDLVVDVYGGVESI
ncbi:AraC family transcriptional regulator [Photobacterium sanctipauli]|uniref:AraC family transcriptional regulator n=1 Tax=Photobacterium sanctipauli TaxID=1342794 RepID=A0A2T3NNF2_9GAMM|nr:helix-turn-helix domain-containing protein [Photobacterium sanctipauli]PSW17244.1 AraC family transcriptional regulator [Photobacterium sanctipauli]